MEENNTLETIIRKAFAKCNDLSTLDRLYTVIKTAILDEPYAERWQELNNAKLKERLKRRDWDPS